MLSSFVTALPMDVASAFYLGAIALLLNIALNFGFSDRIANRIQTYFTVILLALCSIMLCSDISLFKVWGTKTSAKALGYLKYPAELVPTIFNVQNAFLFVLIVLQIIGGFLLYRLFKTQFEKDMKTTLPVKLTLSILSLCISIIAFRGGFQTIPMNRNWVFKSSDPLLNYGALNSFWNIADLLSNPVNSEENPYIFFNPEEAKRNEQILLRDSSNHSERLFTTQRPNIVLVFLESWAADVIGCLGGETNVTPEFCALSKEGIFFDRFYSTGFRTEQGLLATFSATPALPVGSVIQTFGKFEKLPNVYRTLHEHGYHTSYYSGGRLFFDNVEAYLRSAGVDVMKGEDEWEIHKRTVWGAYDEELFAMHQKEIPTLKPPFFSVLATMTTHEWFDADIPDHFHSDPDRTNDRYRNTMHYSDSCLAAYIRSAQKQSWYNQTIFILLADHACQFPKGRSNFEVDRHHIPMLILGGALRPEWKGRVISSISSHTDIAATLLSQLQIPANEFIGSRNIFGNKYEASAYYAFDNGFGLITPNGHLIYDHNRKMETENSFADSIEHMKYLQAGKAHLQRLFEKFLNIDTQNNL